MKFTRNTQAIFFNLKPLPIQQMLDFDYLCCREVLSVAAIVHPGRKGFHKAFFGGKEILIPLYGSLREAAEKHPSAEVLINFASFRSAYLSSKEALVLPSLRMVVIVAEGIPEQQTKKLIALAKNSGKLIIGPSTVGGVAAGAFRIAGYAGGKTENILRARLYRPGSVGLVSKSGGMMNELFHIISRATDGVKEGIAVGGDRYPGSTLLDHLLRYEADPDIHLLVALGELGGGQEYEIIRAKKEGILTKPLVMWVSGTSAQIFPWEVQFGHAGAKAGKEEESAEAKNRALREAGILVPHCFEDLEPLLQKEFQKLVVAGRISLKEEPLPPLIPQDLDEARAQGKVRVPTHFTSTISSGEEPTYGNVPVNELVNSSLGEILGLLWFKKKLPSSFTKFLEMSVVLCADHGPAVAGAHNALVAARAGKDVISALCSGLLTIGPRFGGALDDACRYFRQACDAGQHPSAFVKEMKDKGILIPGIGHRVKSKRNPDLRVELLKTYAKTHFAPTRYLDYALEVEKVTLQKAENLILNVDGCLAVCFLDGLHACGEFTSEDIQEIVELGYLNGFFALSRSIGLIGHILDQKRLREPLYRHPEEDIFQEKEGMGL